MVTTCRSPPRRRDDGGWPRAGLHLDGLLVGCGAPSNLGAPLFNGWPTWRSTTHQQMYYRWLERAWRGGLRLMVQHAVTNEALCRNSKVMPGTNCDDEMAPVDAQIEAAYEFEELRRPHGRQHGRRRWVVPHRHRLRTTPATSSPTASSRSCSGSRWPTSSPASREGACSRTRARAAAVRGDEGDPDDPDDDVTRRDQRGLRRSHGREVLRQGRPRRLPASTTSKTRSARPPPGRTPSTPGTGSPRATGGRPRTARPPGTASSSEGSRRSSSVFSRFGDLGDPAAVGARLPGLQRTRPVPARRVHDHDR